MRKRKAQQSAEHLSISQRLLSLHNNIRRENSATSAMNLSRISSKVRIEYGYGMGSWNSNIQVKNKSN